jgi:hypothetical protein
MSHTLPTLGSIPRYGDDCPVCGREVRSVIEAPTDEDGNGAHSVNSECVQYADDGSRYVFHTEGLE